MVEKNTTVGFSSINAYMSFLLGLAMYFASFGRYSYVGQVYGSLGAWIDFLQINGKYLSSICLAIVAVLHLAGEAKRKTGYVSIRRGPLVWLWMIQAVFLIKIYVAGNVKIAGLGAVVVMLQVVAIHAYITSREFALAVRKKGYSDRAMSVVLVFSTLYILTNLWVLIFHNNDVITINSNRFFGITPNPQHFMLTANLSIPFLLYSFRSMESRYAKYGILLFIVVDVYLIYLTGSRTGLVTLVVIFGVMYRDVVSNPKIYYAGLIVSLLVFSFLPEILGMLQIDVTYRFIEGRGDTRSEYWSEALNKFQENPIIGAPAGGDGKMQYTLGVWVSLLEAGGVVVGVMGLMLLYTMISLMIKVRVMNSKGRNITYKGQMYQASLAALILMSITESVFLGIITSMTMLSTLYMAGATGFVSGLRRRNYIARANSIIDRHSDANKRQLKRLNSGVGVAKS